MGLGWGWKFSMFFGGSNWKIRFFEGGGSVTKNQYIGMELP